MKKIIAMAVMLLVVVTIVMQTVGLAWMSDNGMSSPIDITTNVHKTYFQSGDGSAEIVRDDEGNIIKGPYEIANPLQLYYFAWLQYLGFFNQDSDGDGDIDTTFYFRLSADLDMDAPNADGEVIKYILPPIGTTDNPFIGNFDGEGHSIKNLTVQNQYSSLIDPPEGSSDFKGAEIIGCFGVVGELKVDNPEVKYDYETQLNEVKNVILENLTVKTQTDYALIGLVAGYVNGFVDCVGVVSSTVDIAANTQPLSYTDNMSDYSLIGFCTEQFRKSVYTLNLSLALPGETDEPYNLIPDMSGEGDQKGWGGSVKMSDIYNWLNNLRTTNASSNTTSYVLERVDVVDLNDKRVTVSSDNITRRVATIDGFGSFVFSNATTPNYVNFVCGALKVTQFKYAEGENDIQLYYITDGTNYISLNGSTVTNTTNQANATKWYVSNGANGGVVYAVVDGSVYYLTLTGDNVATVAVTPANNTLLDNLPTWTIVDGDLRCNAKKVECNNGTWRVATATSYYIASGNYYLSINVNNNGTATITNNVTNSANATEWQIDTTGTRTTISTVVRVGNEDRTYYLNLSNNNLSVSTTNPTTWSYDATNVRFYSNNRYLRYSGGWSTGSRSTSTGTNLTLTGVAYSSTNNTLLQPSGTNAKEIVCEESEFIDSDVINGTYDENGVRQGTNAGITYFPLSSAVEGGIYSVDSNNTGYIIGAEWDTTTYDEQDTQASNLRISRYTYEQADMTAEDAENPYAISYKTGNEFIPVEYHDNETYLRTELGLTKYAKCYGEYVTSIGSALNGLHFMNAPITKDNYTTITANLNGKEIDNYQVPINCIDFNLYERGFINAFACSYYSQRGSNVNNSFFSIYQIFREPIDENDTENRKIKEIKEIKEVYGVVKNKELDTNQEYIYLYTDGTMSKPLTSEYEMVFDCEWINYTSKFNGWADKRAFYFEMPVNEGEYAIGSTQRTDGSVAVGAYLVYLDLAANAQLLHREKTYEEITESSASVTIPKGVDLLDPEAEGFGTSLVDPDDSAFVQINNGTSGSIKYDRDGNVISHSAISGTTAEYVGVNGTLVNGNDEIMTVPWDAETKINRTTYRDYNVNTGVLTVTVIDEIIVTEGGETTTSYTKDVTITYPEGHKDYPDGFVEIKPTVGPQEEKLSPDVIDDEDTSPDLSAGDPLLDIAFSYGDDVNLSVSYLYTPEQKDENGNVTATPKYVVTIQNGGPDAVNVKAILTEQGKDCGITFVITDGTTENVLSATTSAQIITINASSTGGESGGETGDDVVDGGEGS